MSSFDNVRQQVQVMSEEDLERLARIIQERLEDLGQEVVFTSESDIDISFMGSLRRVVGL